MVETDTLIKINRKKNKQKEKQATEEYLKKFNPKILEQSQKLQDLLEDARTLGEETKRSIKEFKIISNKTKSRPPQRTLNMSFEMNSGIGDFSNIGHSQSILKLGPQGESSYRERTQSLDKMPTYNTIQAIPLQNIKIR